MATVTGLDRIRTAVGALNAGRATVDDVEQLIRHALDTGTVSKRDACRAVRDATNGRAATRVISRLGLEEGRGIDIPETPTGEFAERKTRIRRFTEPVIRREPFIGEQPDEQNAMGAREPDAASGTGAQCVDIDPAVAAEADAGLVGQLLGGRYLLERQLGSGGMGVVYLASDQEVPGETFAIKVLKPEIRAFPEAIPLLREEVRTTRALKHPHIVGVYSLNSDKNHIYMLMEYLEGKTLDALLDQEFARGMPFSRAWPLIQDTCDALAYAHDHNVIHSDLKPSNVFITMSGRAKLLDFGIARVARTRHGRFDPGTVSALTLAYATCEMLDGQPPDQSDDVYGMACIIYEMLSGRHPFGLLSAREARDQGRRVAPIAALTESQNDALADALAYERSHRTPTIEVLLAGLDVNARAPGGAARLPNARSAPEQRRAAEASAAHAWLKDSEARRTLLVAAAALIAAVMIGLAVWLVWRGMKHATPTTPAAASPTPAATPPPVVSTAAPPPLKPVAPEAVPPPAAPAPTAAAPPEQPSADPDVAAVAAARTEVAAARTDSDAAATTMTAPPSGATVPGAAVPGVATPGAIGKPVKPVKTPKVPSADPIGSAGPQPDPSGAGPTTTAGTPDAAAAAPRADETVIEPETGAATDGSAVAPVAALKLPPIPRKPESVKPLPESEAAISDDANCPYPKQARDQAITGTVQLLVLIAADGSVSHVQLDGSSNSDDLDQAAVRCIQQFGRFAPRRLPPKSAGYWGHMNFAFGL